MNKILTKIYSKLDKFDTNRDNFQFNIKNIFYDNQNFEELKYLIKLALYMKKSNTKFYNMNSLLNLWSFVYKEIKFYDLKDPTFLEFIESIRNSIEQSLGIQLDEHYLIRNKLCGFEMFLQKLISLDTDLDEQCLITIISVQDLLKLDFNQVYSILVKLDSLEESELRNGLCNLFWNIFDELKLNDKIEIIYLIHTKLEVSINKMDNSVSCLFEQSGFNNELLMVLNKLSTVNFGDLKVNNNYLFIIKCVLG